MNSHSAAAAAGRRRRVPVCSIAFTAVLVLAAMLLGLLAMHSIGSHGADSAHAEGTASADATAIGADAGTHASAGVVAAVLPFVASAEVGPLGCADCLLDCAVWAMTCTLLLVLAALIMLARSPATYRLLLDAGGRIVAAFQGPAPHLFRPSLVVLSISRT